MADAAVTYAPWEILGYILLGSILGIIGQGIRVFVGLKKAQQEAEATRKNLSFDQWFDSKQLITSMLIAFVIGGVAGTIEIYYFLTTGATEVTLNEVEVIILAGYAGTDVIEGFISSRKLPT